MKSVVFLLLPFLLFQVGQAYWGWDAHRVTAQISELNLTSRALSNILELTSNQTVVDVCIWADEVRGEQAYTWSGPLHYVNPKHSPQDNECSYDNRRDCVDDFCVVGAVFNYTTQLKEGKLSQKLLEEAFKFLVHFVADMHNPLHVCGIYLGGNDFDVKFDGSSSNLHRVWDSNIPLKTIDEDYNGSENNYIQGIIRDISGKWSSEVPSWIACSDRSTSICPDEWAETIEPINCSHCWKGVQLNMELGGAYYEDNKEMVRKLLAMSGVRLTAVLNELFDN